MSLFTPTLADELERCPGASHSFLRQAAGEDGAPLRALVDRTMAEVGAPVAARWAGLLNSLDNRRFFQGFGEIMLASAMLGRGWAIRDLSWPGPGLLLRDRTGIAWHGLVLSFLRPVRPEADRQLIERLRRACNRVSVRRRLGMVVHRWLPEEFDPEPVRRAVDLWLREVDRGAWNGRHAAYEDERISLEFALTGEKVVGDQDIVAFVVGPLLSQPTTELVGGRLVFELDRLRHEDRANTLPVLAACVTNQPWCLSQGFVRELLYGRASWQRTGDNGQEWGLGEDDAPSLYRDPLYSRLSSVVFLDRGSDASPVLGGRAWQNPWALSPIRPDRLPLRTLSVVGWEEGRAVMRWTTAG